MLIDALDPDPASAVLPWLLFREPIGHRQTINRRLVMCDSEWVRQDAGDRVPVAGRHQDAEALLDERTGGSGSTADESGDTEDGAIGGIDQFDIVASAAFGQRVDPLRAVRQEGDAPLVHRGVGLAAEAVSLRQPSQLVDRPQEDRLTSTAGHPDRVLKSSPDTVDVRYRSGERDVAGGQIGPRLPSARPSCGPKQHAPGEALASDHDVSDERSMPRVLFFLVAVPVHAAHRPWFPLWSSRPRPGQARRFRTSNQGPWKLRIQSSVARKTLRLLEVAE